MGTVADTDSENSSNVYRHTHTVLPKSRYFQHPIFANHLVEPWALQDEQASSEELQNNVVSYEHLQHGACGSTKHSHQQQGVDVSIQKGPSLHVVIEEKPWKNTAET